MADVSSFNSQVPSGSSEVREGDDLLRSHWSDIHAGWTEEHFWRDGSAASGGQHKPGSSRVSFGAVSALGAEGDEGRQFVAPVGESFVVGSSASTVAGVGYVGAKAVQENDQNVAGSFESISLDAASYDNGGFYGSAGDDHLTVPSNQDGIYKIVAKFTSNATVRLDSQESKAEIRIGSGFDTGETGLGGQGTGEVTRTVHHGPDFGQLNALTADAEMQLSAGSQVWADLQHNANGNISAHTGQGRVYLSMYKLGR